MKRIWLAAIAALGVSACAEDYYGPYGGGGMAYYDDYYGPYYGGYWGPDAVFYYRSDPRRPYVRDEGHHFHHDPAQGLHGVQAHPGFHGFAHGGHAGHDGAPGGAPGGRPGGPPPGGFQPH
jgi:hypothetical protein